MEAHITFMILMPRFRLYLLTLAFLGLFSASCSKSHDMSPAHESVYMTIMADMMTQMDAQVKTQDPDHDYASQMVLHHQAAIKMAQEELKSGTNQEMKTTAQTIIFKQQAEIAQFNAFLGGHQPRVPLVPQFTQLQKTNMDRMMTSSHQRTITGRVDYDFALLMVDHHQAAIDNSEALLVHGRENTTRALAQTIIADQRQEITALHDWLTRNR